MFGLFNSNWRIILKLAQIKSPTRFGSAGGRSNNDISLSCSITFSFIRLQILKSFVG
jgi:hypothetical protein